MTDQRDPTLPDPDEALRDVYQPPAGAEETDRADAAVDGTSASHYGANDPALQDPAAMDDE